jgi:hypothetical protein
MTAALLQELARQVRGDTRRILAAAQPGCLTWAPPGTSNHILWHAGHALWLGDVLCVELLTGRSELPGAWEQTFGMNCRPVAATQHWPSRAEIDRLLGLQLDRIVDLLKETPSEKLVHDGQLLPLASRIVHGFHDEAKHQGEMYLLLKMCRALAWS